MRRCPRTGRGSAGRAEGEGKDSSGSAGGVREEVFGGKCQSVVRKGFPWRVLEGKSLCAKHKGREERISWEGGKALMGVQKILLGSTEEKTPLPGHRVLLCLMKFS